MSRFHPESVTGITATVISINEIDLSWVNGEQNGCQVERTVPLASWDSSPANYQTLALVAAGVTSYVDTTVQPGSFYSYRITSLSEVDAPMYVPDKGTVVTATTSGFQNHLDTTRPPNVFTVEFSLPVILNGTDSQPWSNAAVNSDPPIVDPTVNGIPFNS
jgi:hypothetical protein